MTQIIVIPISPLRKKKEKEEVDFLYVSRDIHFFPFPIEMTVPIKKLRTFFFLKGGMGKKSYLCHLSIEALFHILSLVILLQFPVILK